MKKSSEFVTAATIRNFRLVQNGDGREVARNIEFYNLEAIIAVGFRMNRTTGDSGCLFRL